MNDCKHYIPYECWLKNVATDCAKEFGRECADYEPEHKGLCHSCKKLEYTGIEYLCPGVLGSDPKANKADVKECSHYQEKEPDKKTQDCIHCTSLIKDHEQCNHESHNGHCGWRHHPNCLDYKPRFGKSEQAKNSFEKWLESKIKGLEAAKKKEDAQYILHSNTRENATRLAKEAKARRDNLTKELEKYWEIQTKYIEGKP